MPLIIYGLGFDLKLTYMFARFNLLIYTLTCHQAPFELVIRLANDQQKGSSSAQLRVIKLVVITYHSTRTTR